MVKGSGKVEQAKNKRNWETGKIVVKAEIIWKDKKAILLKQKKRPRRRRPIQWSLKRPLSPPTSMDSGDTQAHFETSLKVQ